MKKVLWFIAIIGLIAVLSACGSSNKDEGATSDGPAVDVNAVASNFAWDLDKTTFNKGDNITFNLSSAEGMHGFSIVGTKVSQPIGPGQTKTVSWTPTKAGTYKVACDVMCGTGHDDMVLEITVN